MPLPKLIVILGPTASGKTDFAIALAKKHNGEIISADSRQIYKEMDISTAKPKGDWRGKALIVDGIPHYGFDLVSPDQIYSVAEYKDYAVAVIKDIISRGKLPIMVGGTGLYIRAVTENLNIPHIAADAKLRADLESKSVIELAEQYKKTDPEGAKKIDLKNKRRLVRALEVCLVSGDCFSNQQKSGPKLFETQKIGLDLPRKELYARIDFRVEKQVEEGVIEETKKLLEKGYDPNLPSMTGIGYKEFARYLNGELSLEQAKQLIKYRTHAYARKQITWFRKEEGVRWILELVVNVYQKL